MTIGETDKWIIQDWAGNRKFPDRTFDTFEDGWEFIRANIPDESAWEEFYVVPESCPESE